MKRKILIVDDEPNIVLSLEFLMQQSGYEVAVARDGAEALEMMKSFRPDLILLDVMLPKINGFELCQKIRQDPDWEAVKVIMLSAKGRESEVSKGLALGANLYVTKPFSTRELVEKVASLL